MNEYSSEVWKHAPAILKEFEGMWSNGTSGARDFSEEKREKVKGQLLALLHVPGEVENDASSSKPDVEDFEFALQTALMGRLESSEEGKIFEAIHMLDVTAAVVIELFQRAAQPGSPAAETDKCKAWWVMFFTIAEDVARLIPARHIDQLVGRWEDSLVRLRASYLQLAKVRLAEVDAKQIENDQKKAAEDASEGSKDKEKDKDGKEKDKDSKPKDKEKEAKESATRRLDERKKMITNLWISPNGQLYLTLTSLLKQLASRLTGSTQATIRARIVLLLERLLAMDHKAIANNQKAKSQDFMKLEDLDTVEDATAMLAKDAGGKASPAAGSEGGNLGSDPEVDSTFYQSVWLLQDALQYPDKVVERPESWKSFEQLLNKLLRLFKKYPVQDARRQPWTEPEPMPLRQAPRADAFRVQLDDPAFRQQLLTQVMITFQALEQEANTKMGLHPGPILKSGIKNIKEDFDKLKQSCEAVLEQTRPGFPKMLKHVLKREAHWLQWKGYGCREFERESLEMLHAKANPSDDLETNPVKEAAAKLKLEPHVQNMLKTLRDPAWKVPSSATPNATSEELAEQMKTGRYFKMCEANITRLLDEDKPENGIEEDYKAKKNKVFMWQSRRLFCHHYLDVFAKKENHAKSDFMDFARFVRGIPSKAATEAAEKAAAAGSPIEKAGEDEDEPMPAESPEASVPDAAADVPAEEAAAPAEEAAAPAEAAPEAAAAPAPEAAAAPEAAKVEEAPKAAAEPAEGTKREASAGDEPPAKKAKES